MNIWKKNIRSHLRWQQQSVKKIERGCKIRLEKMEVGYLAMHIERVYLDTLGAQNEE